MMDVVARFWDLPKVEHGAAQVPYIYPPEMMDELNAILRVTSLPLGKEPPPTKRVTRYRYEYQRGDDRYQMLIQADGRDRADALAQERVPDAALVRVHDVEVLV